MSYADNRRVFGATAMTSRQRRSYYDHLDTPVPAASSLAAHKQQVLGLSDVWQLLKQNPYLSLLGTGLLCTAVVLLVWNEGHAVRTSRSLDEGYKLVVSLHNADIVTSANEGKVIHVCGGLSTSPALTDFVYNVEIEAVRLKRRVQMLQWIEEEDLPGTQFESDPSPMNSESSPMISYSYNTVWKDKLVDSGLFNIPYGHENPDSFPLQSSVVTANTVKIGGYRLSQDIVDTFTSYQPFSGDEEPTDEGVKLHGGMYYQTKDIFNPQVGDARVQFYYAGHTGATYSIIGIQRDLTIVPYRSSSSGQDLVLLQQGQRSPEEVFATHLAHARLYNWTLRIVAFCVICAAVTATHEVVLGLVSQCRLLRDVAAMSGGHFALTVAMSVSLTVVALSWCIYRPGLAMCLLLLALFPAIKAGYYQTDERVAASTAATARDAAGDW